jgi:hypothetical protein
VNAGARYRAFATSGRGRAVGHGLVLAGLLVLGFVFLVLAPNVQSFGIDALAYWLVDVPDAYDIPHRVAGSFPYSVTRPSTFSL